MIAKSDKTLPFDEQGLPAELKRAVETCGGKFTPNYEYIPNLRKQNLEKSMAATNKKKLSQEHDNSNSMQQQNVKEVGNIKGEALDFTK